MLDLYCGAGGVSMGLHRAWPTAEIVGIDIKAQPRYPFTFIQADALKPPVDLQDFDFIWASPPCQAHTALKTMHNAKVHPNLIPPTRAMLEASGKPWVMENVPGAPMKNPIMLCGSMFGLQTADRVGQLRRHRLFEMSHPILLTPECQHDSEAVIGVYGGHGRDRRRTITVVSKGGGHNGKSGRPGFPQHQRKEAMGIDWMTDYELSQAIPPAYSEFLAKQIGLDASDEAPEIPK